MVRIWPARRREYATRRRGGPRSVRRRRVAGNRSLAGGAGPTRPPGRRRPATGGVARRAGGERWRRNSLAPAPQRPRRLPGFRRRRESIAPAGGAGPGGLEFRAAPTSARRHGGRRRNGRLQRHAGPGLLLESACGGVAGPLPRTAPRRCHAAGAGASLARRGPGTGPPADAGRCARRRRRRTAHRDRRAVLRRPQRRRALPGADHGLALPCGLAHSHQARHEELVLLGAGRVLPLPRFFRGQGRTGR